MATANYIVGQQDISDPNGFIDATGHVPPLQFQNVPQNTNYPLNGDGRYWWEANALNAGPGDITFIGSDEYLTTSAALTWQITQFATDGSTPAIIYSINGGVSFTQVPLSQALQSGEVTVDFITTSASGLSITSASPAVISWPQFPGEDGMIVELGGTLPAALSSSTSYYVVNATTSSFEVALTLQGTPINTLTSSSAVTAQLAPNGFIWGVDIIQPASPLSGVFPLLSGTETTNHGYLTWGFSDGTVPILPDTTPIAAYGSLTGADLASGYDINVLSFANITSATANVQLSITGLTGAPAQNVLASVQYTGSSGARDFLGSAATYITSGDTATWTWPAVADGDIYFANVGLLAQMTGANGSAVFVDSSLVPLTLTTHGGAVQSNAEYEFAPTSGYFPDNTSYLSTPIVANGPIDLSAAASVFTIEGWAYVANLGGQPAVPVSGSSDLTTGGWYVEVGSGGGPWPVYFFFWNGSGFTQLASTVYISDSTWFHFAVVRTGGVITIYVNGVAAGTSAYNGSLGTQPTFYLGGVPGHSATNPFYVQDIRITKGIARYTGNFTPPAALFPAFEDTDFEPGDTYDVTITGTIVQPPSPKFQVAVACTRNVTQGPVFDYPDPFTPENYNPQAMDYSGYPSATLAELRQRLLIDLGFAMQASNPPPGMVLFANNKLLGAQNFLYRRYPALHTKRFFRWKLIPGQRFYSLADNDDDKLANFRIDPLKTIEFAGIQDSRNVWYPLIKDIPPQLYTMLAKPWRPARYDIRQSLEVYPAPDQTYWLWLRGHFGLMPFTLDTNYTTLDSELVYLWALANAKAHYGQPDANNIASQANAYRGALIAGTHATGHYVPGTIAVPPAVRPTLIQFQNNQGG